MKRRAWQAAGLLLLLVPGIRAEAVTPIITGYQLTTGVAVTSGPPGTQLVIEGTNLGSSGTLKFNGTTLSYNAWANTYIRVVVPKVASYPTTAPFTATTGGGTATGPAFTITGSGTPPPPPPAPSISGYKTTGGSSITSAPPGTSIVIAGANLGSSGTVSFNGIAAAASSWAATAITVTVPTASSYPNTGPAKVTTDGQTATGSNFTIMAPPKPAPALSPTISGYKNSSGTAITSATPGTSVVIAGANLGSSGSVKFNGIAATTTAWSATSITATVPTASSYPNSGPVTVTTGGQTASGATFTITAPPPPPPTISGYQSTGGAWITSALPGTTVLIIGTNLGTSGTVKFNGTTAATTVWTATAITATVPTASSYPSSGPVVVTTGGQSVSGSTFTITAPPATSGVRNVRNYGATGNGSTDDTAAIQKALDAAVSGDSIYFPTGTYHISGSVDVHTSNVRVYGDGAASVIKGDTTQTDLVVVYNSGSMSGVRFDQLHFLGPRVFDKTVNQGSGIALNGVSGTQVTNCIFEGVGAALQESDTSSGTSLSGCQILDWGRVGLFLNGGDNIQSTSFNQHDPNSSNQVTSHGIYIHSGASGCTVQGCSFSGVRYYGIQLYGETGGTTISNILISGNQFTNNAQDIAVETAGPTISGITITGNSFYNTQGISVTVKEGSGIHVDSNQFYNMINGAVVLGNWAPYDAGASLSSVTVNNNTYQISGGTAGQIFVATGSNGSLSNVSFQGNTASGFHEVGSYQMGAIYIDHLSGATVSGNTLTMASGAGSANTCAGVWATNASGVQITSNTVNGTSTQYAYGVYGGGLSSGSAITNNNLYHCKLAAGGASTSGNTVTP
jgi:hypothetical protein